jgi:hypothetical protein
MKFMGTAVLEAIVGTVEMARGTGLAAAKLWAEATSNAGPANV